MCRIKEIGELGSPINRAAVTPGWGTVSPRSHSSVPRPRERRHLPTSRWCLTSLWQDPTPAPAQQRMIDIGPPPGPSPTAGVFCSALGSGAMTYCFGAFAAGEYDALLNA